MTLNAAEIRDALKAGQQVREVEKVLTLTLTRREARARINQAKDLLAMEAFARRMREGY